MGNFGKFGNPYGIRMHFLEILDFCVIRAAFLEISETCKEFSALHSLLSNSRTELFKLSTEKLWENSATVGNLV